MHQALSVPRSALTDWRFDQPEGLVATTDGLLSRRGGIGAVGELVATTDGLLSRRAGIGAVGGRGGGVVMVDAFDRVACVSSCAESSFRGDAHPDDWGLACESK